MPSAQLSSDMPTAHEVEDVGGFELPPTHGEQVYRPHLQIFLPTMIVLVCYGIGLGVLWLNGHSGSALFRLFSLVVSVGVPLLAAHALLRYATVRLRLDEYGIAYHPGWPKDAAIEIPHELISRLRIKRGLSGRLMGGGTLIIDTTAGNSVAVADLRDPYRIIEQYELGKSD